MRPHQAQPTDAHLSQGAPVQVGRPAVAERGVHFQPGVPRTEKPVGLAGAGLKLLHQADAIQLVGSRLAQRAIVVQPRIHLAQGAEVAVTVRLPGDRHWQDAAMLQQVFAEIKHAIAGVCQARRQPLGEAARASEAERTHQGAKKGLSRGSEEYHGHGSAATMRFCARRAMPALA
ncbi:hypothetical protein [Candidatus Skiveiella danica]|uniref:hypothetical protein n=1 Tax=Candidatus Skiveiella danica TaxID=3386177 RepID=UPI0039B9A566